MNETKQLNHDYLTISEVKDYLNISQSKAYELAHRKDFPICRFGGSSCPEHLYAGRMRQQ